MSLNMTQRCTAIVADCGAGTPLEPQAQRLAIVPSSAPSLAEMPGLALARGKIVQQAKGLRDGFRY